MKTEEILSAGIDIGTSTTQLVFSRMVLQNIGGFGKIPQIKVISKEIIYESEVYFTPLLSREEIDGQQVNEIIKKEYQKAGILPEELSTGAVIITGESSRKRNAEDVVKAISEVAGEFVVATAGADLESVLAGKGAGAEELSKRTEQTIVNLDIGGGTTNICVFEEGHMIDTACLDIGGRLVKVDVQRNRISYVAPKIKWLCRQLKLDIEEGGPIVEEALRKLTDAMAQILAEAVLIAPEGRFLHKMQTNHLLTCERVPEIVTFSGGVAACMEHSAERFRYGDIGILLGESIQRNRMFRQSEVRDAKETMRATVIGAGNYSMDISGSTIEYTSNPFPLKNIPVVKLQMEKETDLGKINLRLHKAMQLYEEERGSGRQIAIAMKGLRCPSFLQIQEMAGRICEQYELECAPEDHLIIILESDIGKALGQALYHRLRDSRSIICIDGIHCENGDFVDLGEPLASGNVIPVIVKTLIFNR